MSADKERDLLTRLRRMLVAAQRHGYSVEQAMRAVRLERRLEQGLYDEEHWNTAEELFRRKNAERTCMHDTTRRIR